MFKEKQKIAFSSVCAALFLTAIKFVVALYTGSLGILSETAHSALDLGAAVITLLAVKISDRPPDSKHHYGHGKVESFSALLEVLLLFVTCGWVMYEAIEKLFFGAPIVVDNAPIGMFVVAICVAVDISRSRALKRVAAKYDSLALHADALHFSSDVWSSIVVFMGLICVEIGNWLNIGILKYADPMAALSVSVLIIVVSIKLVIQAVNVLLDAAPGGMHESIVGEINGLHRNLVVSNVRVRLSGVKYFIDITLGVDNTYTQHETHAIVDDLRHKLNARFPNSDILIGTYPLKSFTKTLKLR